MLTNFDFIKRKVGGKGRLMSTINLFLLKAPLGSQTPMRGYVDLYSSVIVKYDLYVLMEDLGELAVMVKQ